MRVPGTAAVLAAAVLLAAAAGATPVGDLALEFAANAAVDNGRGLVVDGDHAYVSGSDGFDVVNVSSPMDPTVVAQTGITSRDADLLHYDSGRTVAVLASQHNGMYLVNVTDPANPGFLSRVLSGEAVHNAGVVPGTNLVYASPGSAGAFDPGRRIAVVNASDPADPTVERAPEALLPCHDIGFAPSRDLAFCAGVVATEIWDVSDPHDPQVLSRVANPAVSIHHWATGAKGGHLLVLGDETGGALVDGCGPGVQTPSPLADRSDPAGALWFYNITEPRSPVPVSYLAAPDPQGEPDVDPIEACTAHFGEVLRGGDSLVAGWYDAGTLLVNITDPLSPRIQDQWRAADSGAWDARVHGGEVYVGDRHRGLDVLNLVGIR